MEYFFYGFTSVVNGVGLTYFGQIVEMPRKVAERFILAFPRALLIPKTLADRIGFTEEELAKYRNQESHATAPPEFRAKKELLFAEAAAYVQGLEESDGSEEAEGERQS